MIEKLTSPENMAVISVTFSVFMLILSMAWPYFRNDPLEGRMKSVALEREKLRAQERAKQANAQQKKGERIGAKKAEASSLIKNIVEKLNLRTALADENTEAMLVHAGYRGSKPLFVFLALRFMLPIGFLAITALYCLFIAERTPDDTMTIAIKCLVAGAIGFYLPILVVKQKMKSRQLSISQSWPDALDLSLICVESGMSIEVAFRKVAAEIGAQSPALAEELMITTAELSFLQERKMAYDNLVYRTGLEAVKNVVLSLVQSEKYGTPLSVALRVLSQENRDTRMAMAEKKAAGLGPKLTVPMMVCFLPVLFCVILGPAVIRTMAQFS